MRQIKIAAIVTLSLVAVFFTVCLVSYVRLSKQEKCQIQEKLDAGVKPWNINEGYDYALTCQLKLAGEEAWRVP